MKILVTGGSSDIAIEIMQRRAKVFSDKVFFTCSSEKSLLETEKKLSEMSVHAKGFVFDLSEPEKNPQSLAAILDESMDGLVLNACSRVLKLRRLHELSFDYAAEYLATNINGNIFLLQKIIPGMLERKFGRLIFVSSVSALTGTSRYPVYCTAKSAIEGLFMNLAVDYGGSGILSNIVRPGIIMTDRTKRFWRKDSYQEKTTAIIPQRVLGAASQVAETLDPLLSKTSYMNGSIVTVSGGLPLMTSEGVMET